MLIECLIVRDGHTVVNVQRSRYEFKRNAENRQVCDVLSSSHAEYLLKLNGDFQVYQTIVEPEAVAAPIPETVPEAPQHETAEKVFTCDNCGKEFNHHLPLASHKRKCR